MFKKFIFSTSLIIATMPQSLANVIGSDSQNFNPIPSGVDFITVHSSEPLSPGLINVGVFVNYAVNTLPFFTETSETTRIGGLRDSLVGLDLNIGYGITNNWEIGISFPFVLKQVVKEGAQARGEFEQTGNTEIRLATKFRIWGDQTQGLAAIFSINQNRITNNPYLGKGANQQIYNFQFAMDKSFGALAIGANIGFRNRPSGEPLDDFPIEPFEDQYIYSLATSYHLPAIDSKLIAELFASQATGKRSTGSIRKQDSSELITGIKYDHSSALAFHFGMGSEVQHAVSSPDWRIYAGTNYTIGQLKNREVEITPPQKQSQPDYPRELPGNEDELFVLRNVNFAFDSDSKVLTGAIAFLKSLASRIKEKGAYRIIIEGHTDSIGATTYNYELGLRRAQSIKNHLAVNEKMDKSSLEVQSFGESRPVADNGNPQGRQLNRRVVFRIFYGDNKNQKGVN